MQAQSNKNATAAAFSTFETTPQHSQAAPVDKSHAPAAISRISYGKWDAATEDPDQQFSKPAIENLFVIPALRCIRKLHQFSFVVIISKFRSDLVEKIIASVIQFFKKRIYVLVIWLRKWTV